MVLTDNQGDILKAGYVRDAVPGWDNPATWTPSGVEGRWGYTVTNFNGVAKGMTSFINTAFRKTKKTRTQFAPLAFKFFWYEFDP